MIAGLSKAVTLYLAPILALTAILLSSFAYLAPSLLLNDRVSLVTVLSSTQLVKTGPAQAVDGPSIFFGVLGSCARANNAAQINCTAPSIAPFYGSFLLQDLSTSVYTPTELSVLPSNAPQLPLTAPPSGSPAFIAVALSLSFIFFVSFTMISFRHKMGSGVNAFLDKPMVQRISAWIGFLSFFIGPPFCLIILQPLTRCTGLTAFLVVRMWFGKAVDDFNRGIQFMGTQGPKLVANTGNAFTST